MKSKERKTINKSKVKKTLKRKPKKPKKRIKNNTKKKTIKANPSTISMIKLHKNLMDQLSELRSNSTYEQDTIKQEIESTTALDKKKQKQILILIHANWCLYCNALMPQWNKMKAKLLDDKTYSLEEIKEIESKELYKLEDVNKNHIRDGNHIYADGYPTMGKIQDGSFIRYTGGRSTDELVQWAKN